MKKILGIETSKEIDIGEKLDKVWEKRWLDQIWFCNANSTIAVHWTTALDYLLRPSSSSSSTNRFKYLSLWEDTRPDLLSDTLVQKDWILKMKSQVKERMDALMKK